MVESRRAIGRRIPGRGTRGIDHAIGQVHDLQTGPQLPGDLGVRGDQPRRVGRSAGFDFSQVDLESPAQLGVFGRFDVVSFGRGIRFADHGASSSSNWDSFLIVRVQSIRAAPGERPVRTAISSKGMCSRLRMRKISR